MDKDLRRDERKLKSGRKRERRKKTGRSRGKKEDVEPKAENRKRRLGGGGRTRTRRIRTVRLRKGEERGGKIGQARIEGVGTEDLGKKEKKGKARRK